MSRHLVLRGGPDDGLLCIMGSGWDDAALRAATLEQLPAIVWAFAGPDLVAVVANQAAREYRNGSRSHLLGKPLHEAIMSENQPLAELLAQVYRTGRTRTFYETLVRVDDEERLVTFTATPMRDDDGEIVGVITYMTDVTETALAKQAAMQERTALQVLQQRLLPAGLPVLPGLRIAARYRTADEQLVAGGDWYDAIVLGPGCIGASVGDVIGHGPAAAAAMGQLRSVLSASLLDRADVVHALRQLQRFVAAVPGARGSTACAAIYDAATGRLRYSCAGHPPPVLIRPDGTAEFLPMSASAPLGLPGPEPQPYELTLEPGTSIMLYSDGAIERPGLPTEHGLRKLLAACANAAGATAGNGVRDAAALVDAVLDDIAIEPQPDDLALLVLSRLPDPVAPLAMRLPATPQRLLTLRRELRTWLTRCGICDDDAIAVQIACGEATANAAEHAYGLDGGSGDVTMSAELTAGSTVVVRVEDTGRWREPAVDPADRGRGLLLMRQCMDDVQVVHHESGTRVELTRRVHGIGGAAAAIQEWDGGDAPAVEVHVDTATDAALVMLTGDLDAAGVPAASLALRRATRGGLLPLTVDLTELDHLASAGVRLLFDLAAELASADGQLVVRVARASAAHHVLDLTGFVDIARVEVVPAAPVAGRPAAR